MLNNFRNDQLIAYCATLFTLAFVFLIAILAGSFSNSVSSHLADFGLGTITGGLLGVLRLPQQRSMTIDNPPSDPVPTTDATTTDEEVHNV